MRQSRQAFKVSRVGEREALPCAGRVAPGGSREVARGVTVWRDGGGVPRYALCPDSVSLWCTAFRPAELNRRSTERHGNPDRPARDAAADRMPGGVMFIYCRRQITRVFTSTVRVCTSCLPACWTRALHVLLLFLGRWLLSYASLHLCIFTASVSCVVAVSPEPPPHTALLSVEVNK